MPSRLPKASTVPHGVIRSTTLFLFLIALIVIFVSHQPQSNQGVGQGKASQTTQDTQFEKSFWQRFSADPVAVLTFGLFVVGAAQAGLFVWQLKLIRKSLADTKKAAKAAKRQARLARDNLIASQRAWIKAEIKGSKVISLLTTKESNTLSASLLRT